MHYSKPMIELVFEIRRRVKIDLKPGIKLANPDLLQDLAAVYHTSKDTILRTLIKELFNSAGEDWPLLLSEAEGNRNETGSSATRMVKVYRGQVSLEKKPLEKGSIDNSEAALQHGGTTRVGPAPTSSPEGNKPVRYYRGVRIS